MKVKYDVVIIGAGPDVNAGLRLIQNGNVSILLADKIVPWENPMPCAEGVGSLSFKEALTTIEPSWVRQVISKAAFHAPSGGVITFTDSNKGYIIDRCAMQRDLALRLTSAGVDCRYGNKVVRVAPRLGGTRRVEFNDSTFTEAKVVIDCSGPICMLGKEEKISCKPFDLEPAYFVHAEDVDIPDDTVHIYMARALAPGGYIWVFPRGKNGANIGIVVGHDHRASVNIRTQLDLFLSSNFPKARIIRRYAGSIPCGYKRGVAALPGFIKAGDAANTINPISRAGIAEALISGTLAGDFALRMLGAATEKELKNLCRDYETAWYKKYGHRHLKLSRVKPSLYSVPDEDFDKAAGALSKVPQEELTMSKIFLIAVGRFPRLVLGTPTPDVIIE